jgi:hypothetical protein
VQREPPPRRDHRFEGSAAVVPHPSQVIVSIKGNAPAGRLLLEEGCFFRTRRPGQRHSRSLVIEEALCRERLCCSSRESAEGGTRSFFQVKLTVFGLVYSAKLKQQARLLVTSYAIQRVACEKCA